MHTKIKQLSSTLAVTVTLTGVMLLNGCQNKADNPQSIDNNRQETTSSENVDEISDEISNETTVQETQPATQEPESSDENTTESNNELIGSNLPQISITQNSKSWYDESDNTLLLETSYYTINVTNDGFDNLADTLRNLSETQEVSDDAEILQAAKDHYSSSKEYANSDEIFFFSNYSLESNIALKRNDANILSLVETYYEYSGGAHGNYGSMGLNYDVQTGKELTLDDLLANKDDFYEKAVKFTTDKLYEQYNEGLFPEYQQTIIDDFNNKENINYYLDAAGIVIIYNTYEVGPYAMGEAHVTLPYSTFGEYLNPKYITTQAPVIANIPANENIAAFTGTTPPVMIEAIYDDYEFPGTSIISGTYAEDLTEGGRLENAYLIRKPNGKTFIIVSADYASDDYVTFVYDITNGDLKKCYELNGAMPTGAQVNLDSIELSMHLDVLGTYSGIMLYNIEDDGTLIKSDVIFSNFNSSFQMTVTKELPVTIDNNKTTLPIGSTLTITGTDNIDKAYFITSDGKEGYITYTFKEDEWPQHYIDGVSELDYFETIPYAG